MATNGKQENENGSRNGGNVVNELMILFLENDWLLYGLWGAAGTGCLIQMILSIIYNRSLNASDRMRSTKMLWLKQMKTRFESGYEWNNRIRNVELFVEKNIGRRKWLGLYLNTWENMSRMMLPFVWLFATFAAMVAAFYRKDTVTALVYLAYGVVLTVILRSVTVLANLKEKQSLLHTNLCEYFENTLQAEARRRYRGGARGKEEYFNLVEQREEIACGKEEQKKELPKAVEQTEAQPQKQVKTAEKKQQNLAERMAKRERRLQKKQEKKIAKEAVRMQQKQKKEQKKVAKLTKRMEKMQRRMGMAATIEQPVSQGTGNTKEENARRKREQLKKKVDVTPAQEDQIISEVLREFLA